MTWCHIFRHIFNKINEPNRTVMNAKRMYNQENAHTNWFMIQLFETGRFFPVHFRIVVVMHLNSFQNRHQKKFSWEWIQVEWIQVESIRIYRMYESICMEIVCKTNVGFYGGFGFLCALEWRSSMPNDGSVMFNYVMHL